MASISEQRQPGTPIKTFYQEVKEGDLRKHEKKSNDSKTGGGARDLRISPVSEFWDEVKAFFPIAKSDREFQGSILSESENNVQEVDITFMGPTQARKNECRICQIPLINGWHILEQEFREKTQDGFKWFFLLTLDDKNQVWASKFCSDQIEAMHEKIRVPLELDLSADNINTIRGIINF